MYNLLITARDGAWEQTTYEYDSSRCFEYTPEYIRKKFESFGENEIATLKTLPTLFLYEGYSGKAKVGRITSILQNYANYTLKLEYVFDVDTAKVKMLHNSLMIGDWEENRTHWAIKDADLIELFIKNKIITAEQARYFDKPKNLAIMQFDVAFSFPGEKRKEVSAIVECLKQNTEYSIFYDADFTAQLAKPNMDLVLRKVYSDRSKLICIFLCAEYESKKWCQLEWHEIREIVTEKQAQTDRIMYFRFDDTKISGVSANDGYIQVSEYTPEKIAGFIVERLEIL
ncbi:hypothetical protein AGMMS50267_13100 [Spirochaetia bacterium]|nr:hypothetical protein AGMMS50267_13100 [Spirochaetia bacterium]